MATAPHTYGYRLEHVFAHAEALSARTIRLSSQGRGAERDELRALTAVPSRTPSP